MPEAATFAIGERLEYAETPSHTRIVTFRGVQDRDHGLVNFGGLVGDPSETSWVVPLHALSRPEPPARQELPIAPAPSPGPSLDDRQFALAQALDRQFLADSAVVGAQTVADRACQVLMDCHQRLRSHVDMESLAADDLVTALRSPTQSDPNAQTAHSDHRWSDQLQAQKQCDIAESAYQRLARELSEARNTLEQCRAETEQAAANVIGGIVSRDLIQLSKWEAEVATLRLNLKACTQFFPPVLNGTQPKPIPLTHEAATIINNPAPVAVEPVGYEIRAQLREQRQAPLVELFRRLIAGEVDADLSP